MQFAGLNYLAVMLAAIASFMFGWLWYGVLFSKQWLDAVGKSADEVKGQPPSPMPFAIAFIAQFIMAWILASVIAYIAPGQVTLRTGVITAAFMWLGFVITSLSVNYAFQGAKPALTVSDGGHWLGVLLLQGAIIGLMGL